jgi:DNA-binding NtrC family response regulator
MPASHPGNPKLAALLALHEADSKDVRGINWIVTIVRENDGDIEPSAKKLGITRQTLYRYLKKYPTVRIWRDRAVFEAEERERSRGVPRLGP